MSNTASREAKGRRRICQVCRDRKALFRYEGRVRADRHHTLCFECFRAERERQRARRLAQVPAPAPLRAGAGLAAGFIGLEVGRRATLTPRQLAHRRQMLLHLAAAGRSR